MIPVFECNRFYHLGINSLEDMARTNLFQMEGRPFRYEEDLNHQLILVSHSWSYGIAKDQRHIGEYAAISEYTKY